MIQFSNKHTEPIVRQMWKICFQDTDEFIDLFFTNQYKHQNALIYFDDGIPTASLQMIPYTITFCGQEISFAYLAGLCTLPEHRKKGYMARLIEYSHRVLKDRGISLAILVPAEEWLFGFYEKYGYQQVFDKSDSPVHSLDALLKESSDLKSAYKTFDSIYRHKDFCVQKSFDHFVAIVEEYKKDGSPDKYNLAGMAYLLDEKHLLAIYAAKYKNNHFCIRVEGNVYMIENGEVKESLGQYPPIEINKSMLCRLLFGYRTSLLEEPLRTLFPEHNPIMNFMLE